MVHSRRSNTYPSGVHIIQVNPPQGYTPSGRTYRDPWGGDACDVFNHDPFKREDAFSHDSRARPYISEEDVLAGDPFEQDHFTHDRSGRDHYPDPGLSNREDVLGHDPWTRRSQDFSSSTSRNRRTRDPKPTARRQAVPATQPEQAPRSPSLSMEEASALAEEIIDGDGQAWQALCELYPQLTRITSPTLHPSVSGQSRRAPNRLITPAAWLARTRAFTRLKGLLHVESDALCEAIDACESTASTAAKEFTPTALTDPFLRGYSLMKYRSALGSLMQVDLEYRERLSARLFCDSQTDKHGNDKYARQLLLSRAW